MKRLSLLILSSVLFMGVAVLVTWQLQGKLDRRETLDEAFKLLQELKLQETQISELVLKSEGLKLNHYDGLVEQMLMLQKARQDLQLQLSKIEAQNFYRLVDPIKKYLSLWDQQRYLLEDIKTQSATLRQGLRYIPVALSQFREESERHIAVTNIAIERFMSFQLFPEPEQLERLQQALSNLYKTLPERRSHIDNIVRLIDANVASTLDLQKNLSQFRQLNSVGLIENIHKELVAQDIALRQNQVRDYLVMGALVLTLLAVLILTIVKALGESQRRRQMDALFKGAVESLSNSYAFFDAAGRLRVWNEEFESLYRSEIGKLHRGISYDQIATLRLDHHEGPIEKNVFHREKLEDGRVLMAVDREMSDGGMACIRIDATEVDRTEQQLNLLQIALEQSPVSIAILNRDGIIEYANPGCEALTGLQKIDLIGSSPSVIFSEGIDSFKQIWKTVERGEVWQGVLESKRGEESYWSRTTVSPVYDREENISHGIVLQEDITTSMAVERERRLTSTVFESAAEAILITDAEGNIESVNTAFCAITGYSKEQVVGENPRMLASGKHGKRFYVDMWRALEEKGCWEGEVWNQRRNGEVYPEHISISSVYGDDGRLTNYVGIFTDITQRKLAEEKIRMQANYDALTSLPNRNLFNDRLHVAIKQAQRLRHRLALMFIDLDGFKHINDTLGHAAGDEVLVATAERLQKAVRSTDSVARLGGDEFTVVLANSPDVEAIEPLLEKILESLSEPYQLDNQIAYLSGSIGITLYPDDGDNAEDLLRNADTAMYAAKHEGRNTYCFFTASMNRRAHSRHNMITALHTALQEQQFDVHYQPVVDLSGANLVCAEALMRWQIPGQGSVAPDKFIPVAEEAGLIVPMGAWILRRACEAAVKWEALSATPPDIAVNVASIQFRRGGIPQLVRDTLADTGLSPRRLILEITESVLMVEEDGILEDLKALRSMGVRLSIDDFGTGYSSLSYLRRFPIDQLKIDRSFINSIADSEEDLELVRAIILMARSLGITVVAEGIETSQQLELIRAEGCEKGQGFLFSRPLPFDQFCSTQFESSRNIALDPL